MNALRIISNNKHIQLAYLWLTPVTVAGSLGNRDRGFESHKGIDVWCVCVCVCVCVCAFFCVCVVLCLGWGLATGWSPAKGVRPSVKWSRNWEINPMLHDVIVYSWFSRFVVDNVILVCTNNTYERLGAGYIKLKIICHKDRIVS
jgi:hypothetical protein